MKVNKDGLRPILKLAGQAILGLGIGLTLWQSPDAVIRENVQVSNKNGTEVVYKSEPVKSTITTIPFVKNNNLSYSEMFRWLGKRRTAAGWIFFVFVTTFVVMAVSNGSNLNDGMDGMCAGNSAIIVFALAVLAYTSSHIGMASYLNIMYVPGSEELVIFICAFIGALIGFLWYNAYPAQVFMGDTGSLAIGGIIAVLAIIIHKELLLPILCGIFFVESLSVIIQTQVFKIYKRKGRRVRVFRATPIHDNFRKLDSQLDETSQYVFRQWPHRQFHESKITVRFWITTIILAALTIITLKMR
jgi:phospho-N-acetylmuramoyl-pentapeptide-transferase